ncbi:hypothetical protein SAMN05446635_5946 [Burkholderia sp. OK233]|nr:hypothetical protein SAMN05446635_5946 [Burkholderia sp. OK233]
MPALLQLYSRKDSFSMTESDFPFIRFLNEGSAAPDQRVA